VPWKGLGKNLKLITMNNRQINFYQFKGKPPFYVFPLMFILVLVVIGVLAIFGLFIGIAVAVGVIVLTALRFINSFRSKKPDKVTKVDDGTTTITLDESDYEIIEKEKKP
jgi:low affinity Fe/Cu permease